MSKLTLFFVILVTCTSNAKSNGNKFRNKTVVSLFYTNNNSNKFYPNEISVLPPNKMYSQCSWLKGFKQQMKLCMNMWGLAKVLNTARSLTIEHCRGQFKFYHWDCTYKKSMFQNIYRETALMYAMTASALMYSAAKACSAGELHNCHCGPRSNKQMHNATLHWGGGCNDNSKDARKIAQRFLRLRHDVQGNTSKILIHNTNVGFKAVRQAEKNQCTCHGLSGSCTLKTCYILIQPFNVIAENLKEKYHRAYHITAQNPTLPSKTTLAFVSNNINFCSTTSGRHCRNEDNCATLCCGRGYEIRPITFTEKHCKCKVNGVKVYCTPCIKHEDRYFCK